MESKNNFMENKRNNFFDGFIIGAIAGSAVAFLLGTKKGREVLRFIKEEGQERLGSLEDVFQDCKEMIGGEVTEKVEKVKEKIVEKIEEKAEPARRKLFKGLSKRK